MFGPFFFFFLVYQPLTINYPNNNVVQSQLMIIYAIQRDDDIEKLVAIETYMVTGPAVNSSRRGNYSSHGRVNYRGGQ